MSLKQDLIVVRALIEKPETWTQRASARNAEGDHVLFSDPTAICFCLGGAADRVALRRAYSEKDNLHTALQTSSRELYGHTDYVALNDRGTHDEVLSLLDNAIANAPETE